LPTLRRLGPPGLRRVRSTLPRQPQPERHGTVGAQEPLRFTVVELGADRAWWCELVQRYHDLGYRAPGGAQWRYRVRSAHSGEQVLACLPWAGPA